MGSANLWTPAEINLWDLLFYCLLKHIRISLINNEFYDHLTQNIDFSN